MSLSSDLSLSLSRDLVILVEIDIDQCPLDWDGTGLGQTNAFGTCTAAGANPCYYSNKTCQDIANYGGSEANNGTDGVRTLSLYKSKTNTRPLKEVGFLLPYVKSISALGQKIESKNAFTVKNSVNITLFNEIEGRPFNGNKLATRFNTAKDAPFWHLLIARHPNIIRRKVRIKLGLATYTLAQFEQIFDGRLEDIKFTDSRRELVLICKDKTTVLDSKVPNKISSDNLLNGAINDSVTTISVDRASELRDPVDIGAISHIEIGTGATDVNREIVSFTGISGNDLTGVVRGLFGTTAQAHSDNDQFREIIQIAAANGTDGLNVVDVIRDFFLNQGEFAAGDVNSTLFNTERDAWYNDFLVRRTIREQQTIDAHIADFKEDAGRAMTFLNEADGKVHFKPRRPVTPLETVSKVSEKANIIENAFSGRQNFDRFVSRVITFFDVTDGKNGKSEDDYNAVHVEIAADIEDPTNFNLRKDFIHLGKAIYRLQEAKRYSTLVLRQLGNPPRTFDYEGDIKDLLQEVADIAEITSRDFIDKDGLKEARQLLVTKRETDYESTIKFTLEDTNLSGRRYAIIGPNSQPSDYDAATEFERKYAFIANNLADPTVGDEGDDPYLIW